MNKLDKKTLSATQTSYDEITMTNELRNFYQTNPLMVSSPFGGVDGVNRDLFNAVFGKLHIDLADKAVLDVGCGRGFLGDLVAEKGGDYTGADFVISRGGFRLAQADAAPPWNTSPTSTAPPQNSAACSAQGDSGFSPRPATETWPAS
jgi:2-polyprenyl-3-methyl-5-hydroxy-6-metoxy-1,4-benzoquinol methylase